MLLLGTLTNRRGQVVAASYLSGRVPQPEQPVLLLPIRPTPRSPTLADVGRSRRRAAQPRSGRGTRALAAAARARRAPRGQAELAAQLREADRAARDRLDAWQRRAAAWVRESDALIQRSEVSGGEAGRVEAEERLVAELRPTGSWSGRCWWSCLPTTGADVSRAAEPERRT